MNMILEKLGNTPLVELNTNIRSNVRLYAKLEYYNPMGSIKDRAASYVLSKLLKNGEVDSNTKLIESSSGNYGIALAAYANWYGLDFTCVIDPLISEINEMIIRVMGAKVIKVTEMDENSGYLNSRIAYVKSFLEEHKNSYWINQYGNRYNSEAYEQTIGREICESFDKLDYIFMGVSSGGTITGVSRSVKKRFPKIKVIAVDMVGSVIFGGKPAKRTIPGIGSSKVPSLLKYAKIDEVVYVTEEETISSCFDLLKKQHLFVGGSSGSVYVAAMNYLSTCKQAGDINALTIFPDSGNRYFDIIYNRGE